jgi:hypothetical protein
MKTAFLNRAEQIYKIKRKGYRISGNSNNGRKWTVVKNRKKKKKL